MALMAAKSDPKCSVVVVNGTGSVFCSGVDLISLSMDLGQSTAEKTSSAIRYHTGARQYARFMTKVYKYF